MMRSIRLAMVAPAIDLIGGAEKHVVKLSEALVASAPMEITIVTTRFGDAQTDPVGVRVKRIDIPGAYTRFMASHFGLGVRPSPTVRPSLLARLSFLIWYVTRTAMAVHRLRPNLVHVHQPVTPALAVALTRKPYVVTLHVGEVERALGRHRRVQWLHRWLLRRARHVIVVSEDLRSKVIELGVSPDKMTVIRNGVDTQRFQGGHPPRVDPNRLAVCTVRRLERSKGVDVLLHAVAATKDPSRYLVHVVGSGSEEVALRKLAEESGISSSVFFHGILSDERVAEILRIADVAVLPSREEGLPLFQLEAMGAAKPVIVTRVGGMPEIVDGNGFVIPSEDPTALAEGLDALADDVDLRERMGTRSRVLVEDRFTWNAVAHDTMAVYKQALGEELVDSSRRSVRQEGSSG